jgi:glutathione-regulated potassium-efflux system ancillary protein KefF
MQWYSVPPLLKLWMDKVLAHGWAYGHNGIALRGKSLMWAVTTGGGESHFDIPRFSGAGAAVAGALYCGMKWLPPFAMHCTLSAMTKRCRRRPAIIVNA